jgi:hypothetical protein
MIERFFEGTVPVQRKLEQDMTPSEVPEPKRGRTPTSFPDEYVR